MKKQLARASWFLTSAFCLLPFVFALSASAADHATVPLLIDGNRPYIDVTFHRPTFTIAKAGALRPKGAALQMPVCKKQGFARTEIQVDGKTYGFIIDTGASFTMVSEVLLKSWGSAHANWPRHQGAFGDAATLGGQTLETMFVPAGTWGTNNLGEFGVTSQREGTFEKYMTQMMTAPIDGSLAATTVGFSRQR